jgi:hypothetical protein
MLVDYADEVGQGGQDTTMRKVMCCVGGTSLPCIALILTAVCVSFMLWRSSY